MPALYHLLLTSMLLLGGCISIPPQSALVSSGDAEQTNNCRALGAAASAFPSPTTGPGDLNPGGFGLLSWNLHRGGGDGLERALYRLASGQDLIAVQEARLDDDLKQVMRRLLLSWDFSPGFELNGDAVGVLSAARSPALARCARRTTEPWLRIPKVALYTLHGLAGSRQRLLLVNLHGINFSVGTDEFEAQLRQAEAVVEQHRGPLIVAGDFNTWSERRTRLLSELTRKLGLEPVAFDAEHRLRVWGRPLDHVFHRGLRVDSAHSLPQPESDHNPLLVRFSLEPH